MLRALDDPSPWMASLGNAVHILYAHSKMARELGMDYNIATILHNLLAFLNRKTDGSSTPELQGSVGACRAITVDELRDPQGYLAPLTRCSSSLVHSAQVIATASPQ